METNVLQKVPEAGKSPLASRTALAGAIMLIGGIVGVLNKDAGQLIQQNAEILAAIFGSVVIHGRTVAEKPLDWKNWTIGGIGIKF